MGTNNNRSAGKKQEMENKSDFFFLFLLLLKMWGFFKVFRSSTRQAGFSFFFFLFGFCFFSLGAQVSFVSHVNPNQPDRFLARSPSKQKQIS